MDDSSAANKRKNVLSGDQSEENSKNVREFGLKRIRSEDEDHPPIQGSASQTIIIRCLLRPFKVEQLQDLLKQNGNIVEFWIEQFKKYCYATFESEEQATQAALHLHNFKWPAIHGKKLFVEYSGISANEYSLSLESQGDESKVEKKPAEREKGVTQGPSLEDYFRKTESEPALYFLPLTDEQVKQRRDEGWNPKTLTREQASMERGSRYLPPEGERNTRIDRTDRRGSRNDKRL